MFQMLARSTYVNLWEKDENVHTSTLKVSKIKSILSLGISEQVESEHR